MFQPADYGPVIERLVSGDRCRALGDGSPDANLRDELASFDVATVFVGKKIADRDMARCTLAGVWLVHDFLDESHSVSQGVSTPSGSFWHGIMHRREGDFSNAKYWFRNVGEHPVYASLADAVEQQVLPEFDATILADSLAGGGAWDPFAFVDACQANVGDGSDAAFCRHVQQAEWELLFDHCYRAAVGA